MKLIVDIHCHTNLDPVDGLANLRVVKYSYIEALNAAVCAGIKVLSFTHHNALIFNSQMRLEASKRGILLLPGVEAVVEGCDVILINPTTDKIETFAKLTKEKARNKDLFVLAPHPFYPSTHSLGFKLIKHIDLFDGIEYCHFHTWWFNVFNWGAQFVAWRYKKSVIGTSDSHSLSGFGMTKTAVTIDHDVLSSKNVTNSLKKREKCVVLTKSVSFFYFWRVLKNVCFGFTELNKK